MRRAVWGLLVIALLYLAARLVWAVCNFWVLWLLLMLLALGQTQ